MIGHGLETLSRLKARAFFALAAGEPEGGGGRDPHLRLQPSRPCGEGASSNASSSPGSRTSRKPPGIRRVYARGKALPSQAEKEESNLSLEWRKRVVFEAELAPGRLNRFSCRLERAAEKPERGFVEKDGVITVTTADLTAAVNARTGLLDVYKAGGIDFLEPGAFSPLVIRDNADPGA